MRLVFDNITHLLFILSVLVDFLDLDDTGLVHFIADDDRRQKSAAINKVSD